MAFDVAAEPSGRKHRGRARPEMNVTPLVDVVLVLLIIFMVVTPLLSKQFSLAIPTRPNEPERTDEGRDPVVVSVDAAGRFRIQRETVADAELTDRLRRVIAAQGHRTIVFDAHDDVPYERAVEALDRARAAGATTIAVATERLVRD